MSHRDTLSLLNPWWEGERSPLVEEWRRREVRWRPKWLDDLSLEPFSLNMVIGPRLVGKTTGLHLLIDELIPHRDPLSILYLNLDLAPSFDAFKSLLDAYLRTRKARGISSSLLIFDEVTGVRGWWKLIKGYVDAGVFRRDVVIVTGSSSIRLRGEVELFPGRMGGGNEITVLPLSFRDYLEVMGLRIELPKGKERGDHGKMDLDTSILLPQASRIKELFENYLKTGGFPLPINGDPKAEEQLIRSLEGEILRAGRSLDIARGVMSSLLRAAPSPISFNSIASTLSISHRTVREYVELLTGLMVLGQALFFEGVPKFRKERKVFVRDPFLARAMSIWTTSEFLGSALYEWVIQEHLMRRFGSVYYWRDGYEVDVIADGLKVEVKAGKPHRRYPRGVKTLDKDDIPLFLALI